MHRKQVGAVIYRGKRVLATGFNSLDRGTNKCQVRIPGRMCAEVAAILKCIRQSPDMLEGASIFVCRLKRDGTIGLAKPCHTCQNLIDKVGIKNISYTLDNGEINYEYRQSSVCSI